MYTICLHTCAPLHSCLNIYECHISGSSYKPIIFALTQLFNVKYYYNHSAFCVSHYSLPSKIHFKMYTNYLKHSEVWTLSNSRYPLCLTETFYYKNNSLLVYYHNLFNSLCTTFRFVYTHVLRCIHV